MISDEGHIVGGQVISDESHCGGQVISDEGHIVVVR